MDVILGFAARYRYKTGLNGCFNLVTIKQQHKAGCATPVQHVECIIWSDPSAIVPLGISQPVLSTVS